MCLASYFYLTGLIYKGTKAGGVHTVATIPASISYSTGFNSLSRCESEARHFMVSLIISN